jgi:hypothetical protein
VREGVRQLKLELGDLREHRVGAQRLDDLIRGSHHVGGDQDAPLADRREGPLMTRFLIRAVLAPGGGVRAVRWHDHPADHHARLPRASELLAVGADLAELGGAEVVGVHPRARADVADDQVQAVFGRPHHRSQAARPVPQPPGQPGVVRPQPGALRPGRVRHDGVRVAEELSAQVLRERGYPGVR